mmetsp:Transcript_33431/g.65690  ORF Transcript_33431/g.65690 Transcript_33431/m.65690 type:complete len:220 (+) Transcript_33431:443-1102(+)
MPKSVKVGVLAGCGSRVTSSGRRRMHGARADGAIAGFGAQSRHTLLLQQANLYITSKFDFKTIQTLASLEGERRGGPVLNDLHLLGLVLVMDLRLSVWEYPAVELTVEAKEQVVSPLAARGPRHLLQKASGIRSASGPAPSTSRPLLPCILAFFFVCAGSADGLSQFVGEDVTHWLEDPRLVRQRVLIGQLALWSYQQWPGRRRPSCQLFCRCMRACCH